MRTLLTFFLFSLLSSSCSNEGEPLDSKAKRAIDSISTAQIRTLRHELDSLCVLEKKQNIERLVDSIKEERRREINELTKSLNAQE